MGESLGPWLKGGSPGWDAEGSSQENADLRPGQALGDTPVTPKPQWHLVMPQGQGSCQELARLCQAAAPPQPGTCSRRD